jgi:hypothetical protein
MTGPPVRVSAYYSAPVDRFLTTEPYHVLGALASAHSHDLDVAPPGVGRGAAHPQGSSHYTPHERQGRAVHPADAARVSVRRGVSLVRASHRRAQTLAALLQLVPPSPITSAFNRGSNHRAFRIIRRSAKPRFRRSRTLCRFCAANQPGSGNEGPQGGGPLPRFFSSSCLALVAVVRPDRLRIRRSGVRISQGAP